MVTQTPTFNDRSKGDDTPLTRNTFATEFNDPGDTIKYSDRYALHARKILSEEENFLGLFALDIVLKNKKGQYRKCDITPSANHPLLLFYQFHALHDNDKQRPDREWKYLPDRPDLDKILALLHDEGEDTIGFTSEELKEKLNSFINNIDRYVENHNKQYPLAQISKPSAQQIETMRNDIDEIITTFDALTHGYKGKKTTESYHSYHERCLANARAARIKAVDKLCNVSTFVYRNKELIKSLIERLGQIPMQTLKEFHSADDRFSKYRDWIFGQISTARDLYFTQKFSKHPQEIGNYGNKKTNKGFIKAAISRYPDNKKFFKLMKKIMTSQLEMYDHNVANEKDGHGSPDLGTIVHKYEDIAFSPRINLLQITRDRFAEVTRIDRLDIKSLTKFTGMFGINFPSPPKPKQQPSLLHPKPPS